MVIVSSLGYCRTALQGTRHCVELPFPWATLPQMQKGFCYLCDLPVSGVLRCYLHSMWYSNFIYSLKFSVKASIPWPVFLNFRHCSFWSLQEDADTSVTEDSILGAWSRHSDSDTWAFIMYCGMASGWKMAREYHLLQCCLSIGCLCSLLPHLLPKLPKCWIVGRSSSLSSTRRRYTDSSSLSFPCAFLIAWSAIYALPLSSHPYSSCCFAIKFRILSLTLMSDLLVCLAIPWQL